MTHREREGSNRRALGTCAVLAALTVVLYACGATAPASPEDGGAADAAVTDPGDEVPVVDPCSTLPRGDSSDARWYDVQVGCKGVGRPRGSDPIKPTCESAESWLDFGGDGVARRWQAPYREACAGPSVQLPMCIFPNILEACSSADRTRSCFRLTSSRQDVGSPETIPSGHYLDPEGRCWTLYDGHVSGNYGAEGDPVDGTFRATAERCGARLEISGRFHASLAWKFEGTCK